jgi:cytochrome c2
MHVRRRNVFAHSLMLTAVIGTIACGGGKPKAGTVLDEALLAKRTVDSFPAADEDYFHDMDGGVQLTKEQVQGRNMWIVWTGGNDRLWDVLSRESFGSLDFLKTVSSHPTLPYSRDTRWTYLGLVNEPCFTKATGPDPNRYGLWLDVRDPKCKPDPFENEEKYKGVQVGARGKTVPVGSYYGEATGIVGLRLFPNPDFDEKARREWDSERYYRDQSYYEQRDLVKPYRVAMSCGFCHVGPNPVKPPKDPERPEWANLSSNVGAQFFWWDRVFDWKATTNEQSFLFQALHTSLPGTLDTSLVSTDNINNPRTMNAVYYLGPRMTLAKKWGKETLSGGGLDNKQFNEFVPPSDPLAQFFTPPSTTWTPRVLKDGSDSVGALGALNRVYLNIGLFSEEWLLHFRPLIGGQEISPIRIADARKNSVYWQAIERQTPYMASFFLATTDPHYLRDAPNGPSYLTEDAASTRRGKTVFAERCARCHSSKIPPLPVGLDLENCNGKNYLGCWDKYWAWTKTDAFKAPMRDMVLADDFLKDNFLSTELRVPSTLMQTNICSPIATNAIAGNIWDNFSSQSYKDLPSVGSVQLRNPLSGAEYPYTLKGGGRGFTRPASLVSLWSTAPFLQNNSVGPFDPSPSVEARMKVFQASIDQMLWPERRRNDELFTGLKIEGAGVGWIQRTTSDSFIRVPEGYLPDGFRPLLGIGRRLFPYLFRDGEVSIGPIPKGTPVSLITSMDLLGADLPTDQQREHRKKLVTLLKQIKGELKRGGDAFGNRNVLETMLSMSNCPDLVINKGHYFGTNLYTEEPGLSDAEKRDLIGFLKTM